MIYIKGNKIILPKFTPYESVSYRKIDSDKNYKIISERRTINELLSKYISTNYKYINIRQNIEYIDIRDFQFNYFNTGIKYTYVTDLMKYEIETINRKNKREINDIEESGLCFKLLEDKDINDLKRYMEPFFYIL